MKSWSQSKALQERSEPWLWSRDWSAVLHEASVTATAGSEEKYGRHTRYVYPKMSDSAQLEAHWRHIWLHYELLRSSVSKTKTCGALYGAHEPLQQHSQEEKSGRVNDVYWVKQLTTAFNVAISYTMSNRIKATQRASHRKVGQVKSSRVKSSQVNSAQGWVNDET